MAANPRRTIQLVDTVDSTSSPLMTLATDCSTEPLLVDLKIIAWIYPWKSMRIVIHVDRTGIPRRSYRDFRVESIMIVKFLLHIKSIFNNPLCFKFHEILYINTAFTTQTLAADLLQSDVDVFVNEPARQRDYSTSNGSSSICTRGHHRSSSNQGIDELYCATRVCGHILVWHELAGSSARHSPKKMSIITNT
ncbi:unnamed protein product, partial [Trichogramma brassicae]